MIESGTELIQIIFLVGAVIVVNIFVKAFSRQLNLPSLVGYIVVGLLLRIADIKFNLLTQPDKEIFYFLAEVGVITLLFRIGLESNVHNLIGQLKRASLIWIVNVIVCGVLGYLFSYYLFEVPFIPSLFIGVALTATSVGISVGVWKEANALGSKEGELLLDIAELDDISGIILMALLFSVLPYLQSGQNSELLLNLSKETVLILLKLIAFGGLCAMLSWLIERYVMNFFKQIESLTELMLMVSGIGFIVAALAGMLGFSIAIGAFFAGLIFSRDKDAVKIDASYNTLDELFSPFFFVGIGISIDPSLLTKSAFLGLLLIAVGVSTKIISVALPARLSMKWTGALLLGMSMVPRAEIALIIMQRGLAFGNSVIPVRVFNAMVMLTSTTCLLSPFFIRLLLKRWAATTNNHF